MVRSSRDVVIIFMSRFSRLWIGLIQTSYKNWVAFSYTFLRCRRRSLWKKSLHSGCYFKNVKMQRKKLSFFFLAWIGLHSSWSIFCENCRPFALKYDISIQASLISLNNVVGQASGSYFGMLWRIQLLRQTDAIDWELLAFSSKRKIFKLFSKT